MLPLTSRLFTQGYRMHIDVDGVVGHGRCLKDYLANGNEPEGAFTWLNHVGDVNIYNTRTVIIFRPKSVT